MRKIRLFGRRKNAKKVDRSLISIKKDGDRLEVVDKSDMKVQIVR